MQPKHWMMLVVAALASMALAFTIGGFPLYVLVQGIEAAIAGVILLVYGARFRRHDPRESKWPPLLPLAAIALTGAAKNFFVARTPDEVAVPWWLAAPLLAAVGWFVVASIRMLKRRAT